MTRNLIYLSLALLCLSSCVTSSYEKAIADWIQTDGDGTWTDMKFDLIEVIETKELTVADSILILRKRFERMKELKLDSCKKSINRGMLMTFNRYNYSAVKESNEKKIEAFKSKLDSLHFSSPYADRDTTEVLAIFMKCKYSIFSPKMNTRQEKKETFLLTPDQSKCLGRMKKNI